MADPTPYTISYNFSGWQMTNPTKPLPAQKVDNELANIKTALDSLANALSDIRRSDGLLPNRIVSYSSLSDEVKALIGGNDGVT